MDLDSLHGILMAAIGSLVGAVVVLWRWSVARIEAQTTRCERCNSAQEKRVDEIYGMVIGVIEGASRAVPKTSDGPH